MNDFECGLFVIVVFKKPEMLFGESLHFFDGLLIMNNRRQTLIQTEILHNFLDLGVEIVIAFVATGFKKFFNLFVLIHLILLPFK